MTFRAISTLATVVMLSFGGAALAVDDPIKTRQDLMKGIGDSMKALGQMAKGEIEYDAAKAQAAVETIHTNIQTFPNHFPEGSTEGKTEAGPKIWTDMEGFETIANNLEMASADAIPAVGQDLDSLRGALGAIGKSCKECHEGYRVKKD